MTASEFPTPPCAAAPPSVSAIIRTLCAPWMFYKRTMLRPRQSRAVFERVLGQDFVVWPGVLNPVTFRAGRYLAEFIARTPHLNRASGGTRPTALDLGTGCGIQAVFAALRGYDTTAIDIEPGAVSCARANAILNGVEHRLRVLQGDLFAPVNGQSFDLVVFNLPFFRGVATTPLERAWRSPDILERCAFGLPVALRKGGAAYFVLSNHGDPAGLLSALSRAGLSVERVTWRHFGVETMAIYSARHASRDA